MPNICKNLAKLANFRRIWSHCYLSTYLPIWSTDNESKFESDWFALSRTRSMDLNRRRESKHEKVLLKIMQGPNILGSGCASLGRAVASNTRGPRLESSHQQNLNICLCTINCFEKMKTNEKRPGMVHFFKKNWRESWSSGSGRRLMFQRLWVRIPAPYTGWTFFTYLSIVKFVIYVWK